MSTKNIIFITNTINRGGASRVITILANHYAEKKWNVSIMLRQIENSYYINENIKIIRVGSDSETSRFKWIGLIRKYVKEQSQNNKCIVVSFLSMVNVYTIIATRGLDVKVIVSERNDIKKANAGFKFHLANYMYGKADAVVFQSKRVKNYFSRKVKAKGTIILNPVRIKCEAESNCKNKIVNSGRLVSQKNQIMLIEAFYKFHKEHLEYNLYIYGEGELREALENKITELGLSECVFLPGNVENIHEQIADAKFFVLSSNYEGLSNSLLECMMMGLPCISTDCAGSDEIINDHYNGILVPVGNVIALAKAMKILAEDDKLRKAISIQAKKDSAAFYYENVINQWENVFENT